jgi:uncharacterized protein with ParB-like and HNH nuclease domain
MQFEQTTVLGFFDSSKKHFIIPVYQRAYAWEEKEWRTFLSDLKEQAEGSNNYFYGNILMETITKDVEYEIIDGQQRLTTLVIFFRSLLDVLKSTPIDGIDANEDIEKIFIKDCGNIKLQPVDYDRACFNTLIIDGKDNFETTSPSQKRILDAKTYFTKQMKSLSKKEIIAMYNKLVSTELTCIKMNGKKDSALMFELQNNRGKDLTEMEKLKSYCMYQMYVYSTHEEAEMNILHISNIFKDIYMAINDIKTLKEDQILIYHCYAYINGYSYRSIDDIKNKYKKESDKVEWLKGFVEELRTSFLNIKKFELSNEPYLNDLKILGIPAFAYPFIIKGLKYYTNDAIKLNQLYHILEIIIFRNHLVGTRADISSRLNEILLNFDENLEDFKENIVNKLNNAWYWSDFRVNEVLNGYMYENGALHYLLWKYEESLQMRGYKIGNLSIVGEQIEHISPQVPPSGEPLAIGYEVNEQNEYSEDFYNTKLNCIGNLMLISASHNSSIGNKPFKEKLASYKQNPILKQQMEIEEFIQDEQLWDSDAIIKRKQKIVDFANKKWSFDNIE